MKSLVFNGNEYEVYWVSGHSRVMQHWGFSGYTELERLAIFAEARKAAEKQYGKYEGVLHMKLIEDVVFYLRKIRSLTAGKEAA